MRSLPAPLRRLRDACLRPGRAPAGLQSTGSPQFAVPSSLLGVPALSLPLFEVDGMPLGLQVLGFANEDARRVRAPRRGCAIISAAREGRPMDDRPPPPRLAALERYRDGPPRTRAAIPTCTSTCWRSRAKACWSSSTSRSTKTPRCTRWCAGSIAAAFAEPRAQGVPVHAADRLQGPPLRHRRAGRRPRGQPRRLSHRLRQAARRHRRGLGQRHRQPDRAARSSTMRPARRS